jgi:azurin
MKRNIIAMLMIGLVVACTNKQPATTQEPSSYEFTIHAIGNTMSEMDFDTREIKVKANSHVTINLVNTGTDAAMLHNLVIVKNGTEKEVAMEGLNYKDEGYFNQQNTNVIAGTPVATPGLTVNVEFTAPEKGKYTYLCTYPGHWMKMQGTLVVE